MRGILILVCALAVPPAGARVQRDLLRVRKRAGEVAEPARWTLADWLGDANGPALLRSLVPLDRNSEFVQLSVSPSAGQFRVNDQTTGFGARVRQDRQAVDADLFVSIFNAHAELERFSSKREARALALGLRLLGTSARTTSLVARVGWQTERESYVRPEARTARRFAEGRAQLYLWAWFGVNGGWRGYQGGGYRYEVGGFAELWAFRLFADYQREAVGERVQDGLNGGVKIFF